ncbi:MAG: FAD-binding protein [Myxococcaceae bacterium]|nr:FAD-binding protein [Myxococcaceae bacterium]MBH2006199.1 FAD-binding protein [Myxococcaceae bacterium]
MRFETAPQLLQRYAQDEAAGVQPCLPCAVAFPETSEQVRMALDTARKNNWCVVPRGAGTGKAGGCVPVGPSLVLDFSKMNRILSVDAINRTARVQPGVVLAEFQAVLDEQGLFYPPDPNSLSRCTIGGNVATNAAGPSSLKYGPTRDYVLGLEVVLANGQIVRLGKETLKGVAGYDLVSLICGSEGTLALVTEIVLKVIPKVPVAQTLQLWFQSDESAMESVFQILRTGILPRVFEFADKLCGEGQASVLLELESEMPEASWRNLQGVVESEIALDEGNRRRIWSRRRQLSENLQRRAPHKLSEDIAIPLNRLPEFAKRFKHLGDSWGIETAIFGHVGEGNLHAQILSDSVLGPEKQAHILSELFKLTIELNGTISGEHGIGLVKKPYLPLEQSAVVIDLQRAIKKVFDPEQILNPAKIFEHGTQ